MRPGEKGSIVAACAAADKGPVFVAMVEAGTLRPVIDATYLMPETAAAIRHIEMGHARGKVVVAWPR